MDAQLQHCVAAASLPVVGTARTLHPILVSVHVHFPHLIWENAGLFLKGASTYGKFHHLRRAIESSEKRSVCRDTVEMRRNCTAASDVETNRFRLCTL